MGYLDRKPSTLDPAQGKYLQAFGQEMGHCRFFLDFLCLPDRARPCITNMAQPLYPMEWVQTIYHSMVDVVT